MYLLFLLVPSANALFTADLKALVNDCLAEDPTGNCPTHAGTHGNINTWDTSQVQSFSMLFYNKQQFNQDISAWDTSAVTDMSFAFFKAYEFNQDISSWDTSRVLQMRSTFRNAKKFNQDISSWDVGKAADLQFLFAGAENFDQDLSCWNTPSPYDTTINHDTMFSGTALQHYPCWYDRWYQNSPNNPATCSPCSDICAGTVCTETPTTCPQDTCACTPHFKDNGAGAKDGLNATLTQCTCLENQHVQSNQCQDCPPGTTNAAGDQTDGADTQCAATICEADFHVLDHKCEPCPGALAGEDASGPDTECAPCSLCQGTCTDSGCVCDQGRAGKNCEFDTTEEGRKDFKLSLKKSLPSNAELIDMHDKLKDFVLESKQDIVFELETGDLLPHQQAILAKSGKKAKLTACEECIVDIDEDTTFVHTNTWTILRDGTYLSKQTKISENEYDMQCWNDGWQNATRYNTQDRKKLFECNGYVILVGSQAVVCSPDMCDCKADDLTYTCADDTQAQNCYDLQCSDFGGYKQVECDDCDHAECCNYATREAFNIHCESLAPADFVQEGCCLRDTC